MIDQDEAASSAGERGQRSTHRAREAGPPRRKGGFGLGLGLRGVVQEHQEARFGQNV